MKHASTGHASGAVRLDGPDPARMPRKNAARSDGLMVWLGYDFASLLGDSFPASYAVNSGSVVGGASTTNDGRITGSRTG
jgi:hypothetical protein